MPGEVRGGGKNSGEESYLLLLWGFDKFPGLDTMTVEEMLEGGSAFASHPAARLTGSTLIAGSLLCIHPNQCCKRRAPWVCGIDPIAPRAEIFSRPGCFSCF